MSADPFDVDDAALAAAEAHFDRVTAAYPLALGKRVSAAERARRALPSATLTYGEVAFAPLAIALQKIKRRYGGLTGRGGRFVDIGAGTGKALVAAALCHPFDECVGIEVRVLFLSGACAARARSSSRRGALTRPSLPHPGAARPLHRRARARGRLGGGRGRGRRPSALGALHAAGYNRGRRRGRRLERGGGGFHELYVL